MIDDPILLNDWYIVAAARELKEETLLAARLYCGEMTAQY